MKTERRFFPVEVRADESGNITGHAAVFYREADPGTEFELFPGLVERIMPNAFDRAVAEDDVRALFNHDSNQVLGRNRAGTLQLTVDDKGLRFDIDPPDTQLGRDLQVSLKRGDITGSSFAFRAVEEKFIVKDDNTEVREIHAAELFDVGPVTFPAYTAADSSARDLQSAIEAERERRDADEPEEPPAPKVAPEPDPKIQADADALALRIKIANG